MGNLEDKLKAHKDAQDKMNAVIAEVAQNELGVDTLEVRNRRELDFHDLSACGIRDALMKAYDRGVANRIASSDKDIAVMRIAMDVFNVDVIEDIRDRSVNDDTEHSVSNIYDALKEAYELGRM